MDKRMDNGKSITFAEAITSPVACCLDTYLTIKTNCSQIQSIFYSSQRVQYGERLRLLLLPSIKLGACLYSHWSLVQQFYFRQNPLQLKHETYTVFGSALSVPVQPIFFLKIEAEHYGQAYASLGAQAPICRLTWNRLVNNQGVNVRKGKLQILIFSFSKSASNACKLLQRLEDSDFVPRCSTGASPLDPLVK